MGSQVCCVSPATSSLPLRWPWEQGWPAYGSSGQGASIWDTSEGSGAPLSAPCWGSELAVAHPVCPGAFLSLGSEALKCERGHILGSSKGHRECSHHPSVGPTMIKKLGHGAPASSHTHLHQTGFTKASITPGQWTVSISAVARACV